MAGPGRARYPGADTVLTLDLGVGLGCRQHGAGTHTRDGSAGRWVTPVRGSPADGPAHAGRFWPRKHRRWRSGGATRETGWCMDRAWG